MPHVLDTCAVIAFSRDEPGSDVVEAILLNDACVLHALMAYELYKECLDRGGDLVEVTSLLSDLEALGVTLDNQMDDSLLRMAAVVKSSFKMAIPDAFGVAAAEIHGGEFISSDRGELQVAKDAGRPVRFFR